jgi:hypothetical protein
MVKFNVDRGDDGRLIAEGWHGFACCECDCYHIELLDRDERVFAVTAIDSEALIPFARALIEHAFRLHQKGEQVMPTSH